MSFPSYDIPNLPELPDNTMAAADYYNSHPPMTHGHANPTYLAPPPPQPQRASSHPTFVYPPYQQSSPNAQAPPQHHPPPPYEPIAMAKPNPPYAQPQPQRNSFSYPQRPDPQTWISHYPSPGPPNSNLHPQYKPQQFPPPPQQHRPSYSQPYIHPNQSSPAFASGYVSDPEHHRRHRKHHRKSQGTSRSTDTDGFLGAAGGGLIGDLIFPGLGTVGGALAGWIGGKEYGTHRKRKESQREIAQREWEEKFDPDGTRAKSKERARRRSRENRG